MAKNRGREFATTDDDERKRFELKPDSGTENAAPEELDLENPRDADRMGRVYATPSEEIADPEHRDGMAAQADTEAHEESVRRREQNKPTRP